MISPTTNTVTDTIAVSSNPDVLGVAVSNTGSTAGDVYVLTNAQPLATPLERWR